MWPFSGITGKVIHKAGYQHLLDHSNLQVGNYQQYFVVPDTMVFCGTRYHGYLWEQNCDESLSLYTRAFEFGIRHRGF